MRQASVLVADDLSYSLNGKLSVTGVYVSDIVTPFETTISQLIFLFIFEADPEDPFLSITINIQLPGGQNIQHMLDLSTMELSESDKTRWTLRWPVPFYGPILKHGPIIIRAFHEKGEINVAAPFIRVLSHPLTENK